MLALATLAALVAAVSPQNLGITSAAGQSRAAQAAVIMALCVLALVLAGGAPAWVRARRHGAPLGFAEAVGMQLRGTGGGPCFEAAGRARKLGLLVSIREIEMHTLAGGDAIACVERLGGARSEGTDTTWAQVAAEDLERARSGAPANAATKRKG